MHIPLLFTPALSSPPDCLSLGVDVCDHLFACVVEDPYREDMTQWMP